ncbi:THUMP-like domain-containing protein [Pleomorphovibrio marinus]|uniref:THUMP-like domain-containing protein n=1 Tax=Pleomorphovibrio marinus TaxID=2164132 RepID=UPI000E0ACC54|nr:class I SAM-dependent methyltransferase [Pleomorphovibrio marinus]
MDLSTIYTKEFFNFVQDHLSEDPAQFVLKWAGKTTLDVQEAAAQIAAWKKARNKLPEWSTLPNIIYPPALSLEQSSSESTARYKGLLSEGDTFLDLTGGFGVDTFYIGRNFKEITYVEKLELLFRLANHNLRFLLPNKDLSIHHGEGIEFLKQTNQHYDLIYIDPARRGKGNQKLYELTHTEPDVVSNWNLICGKTNMVMVKASPMLDIQAANSQLPGLDSLHIIAFKNEIKELVLKWKKGCKIKDPTIHVIELTQGIEPIFSINKNEERQIQAEIGAVERFLVIPHPGILKAGAFHAFGHRYGLVKIHPNTHIYTSDRLPDSEIPGKRLEVKKEIKLNKKEIKQEFPEGIVNVISKNHPLKAQDCKTKFNLKDGGDRYLLLLTDQKEQSRVFICDLV